MYNKYSVTRYKAHPSPGAHPQVSCWHPAHPPPSPAWHRDQSIGDITTLQHLNMTSSAAQWRQGLFQCFKDKEVCKCKCLCWCLMPFYFCQVIVMNMAYGTLHLLWLVKSLFLFKSLFGSQTNCFMEICCDSELLRLIHNFTIIICTIC